MAQNLMVLRFFCLSSRREVLELLAWLILALNVTCAGRPLFYLGRDKGNQS